MGLFDRIVQMSVTGSLVFFLFLFFRPITKKHFNSSWHYRMLVLGLVFFLIPVNTFIGLPIRPITNLTQLEGWETEILQMIKTEEEIGNADNKLGQDKEEAKYHEKEDLQGTVPSPSKVEDQKLGNIDMGTRSFRTMIIYTWLLGLLVLLLIRSIGYIKFRSYLLKKSEEVETGEALDLFNSCKDQLNIKRPVPLLISSSISSPMLVGIFKPMVVIPNPKLDNKRLGMIFAHELHHFRRKDILIKALGLLINAIHWFNPLIYLLIKEMDKFCEYSIDEKVVEEMDMDDRKHYGETILSLADSSIIRKPSLSTAMGANGKQLKNRLENMIYSARTTRKKVILSLFVGLLILASGLSLACSILPNQSGQERDSFAVYIKEDGLYYSYLDGGRGGRIHEGDSFQYPLISKKGSYIAYTKGSSLYIYNVKEASYKEIDDEMDHYYRAYDWIDDQTLVYGSDTRSGFKVLDMANGKESQHKDQYYYTGLVTSNNKKVYGSRMNRWTTPQGEFVSSEGIVEIALNKYDNKNKSYPTNIIVEGRSSTEETIGYNPLVWDISADGRYIYIMEKPASGSLSSDGIAIGIYDVKEKTHSEFADITTLAYKNHLALNPNRHMLGLIEGAGREMVENKEAILMDINKDKSYKKIEFMDKDLVAMTPSFSLDGNRLLYSASKNLGQIRRDFETSIYERWDRQAHHIYQYNLENSQVEQISYGESYDFLPLDISNDEILFVRYEGNDNYSLVKLENDRESIVADKLIFRGGKDNYTFGFYGHIDSEMALDIFINKTNRAKGKESINKSRIDDLYKLKGTYIGDNSKVSQIISLLDFPEELTAKGIELFTKEKPFGLGINFQASDEIIAKYISTSSDYVWRPQSLVLFSLIDNLEYIQYGIENDDVRITASYINRQVADSLTMSTMGHRVSQVTSRKKLFKDFYHKHASEANIRLNEPEGLVGHIVIKGNTLHFREAEVVEWDDQERVRELGLNEADFPNGYSIIPGDSEEMTFELTDETIYTFTDVNNFFISKAENKMLYTTTKKEEALKHLGEYKLNDNQLSEQTIPYFIEVRDGKVISITEKFKYTI